MMMPGRQLGVPRPAALRPNFERRHGDPFPLPCKWSCDLPFRGSTASGIERQRRVHGCVSALNHLAAINSSANRCFLPITSVQQQVLDGITGKVNNVGPRPASMSEDSALRELLSMKSLYSEEPKNLASYNLDHLKIAKSVLQPKKLASMLPPRISHLYQNADHYIERTAADVASRSQELGTDKPIKPYWDPKLRFSRAARWQLLLVLHKTGILGFRRSIKAKVGLFFVKKKRPNEIRMVVDARQTNWLHRSPPTTRLAAGSNYVELDLSDDAIQHAGVGGLPEIGFANEADVSDCFYNYDISEMAEWFGIDDPITVKELSALGAALLQAGQQQ
jgi:hypothetical protein